MLAAQFRQFIDDESGATAIEYGLLSALIAVALIASFVALGGSVQNLFAYGIEGSGNVIANAIANNL